MDAAVFKPFVNDDIGFITELYNYYVKNTTVTYHINKLTEKEVYDYFHFESKKVFAFIICIKNENIGFCLLKPYSPKEGYKFTYEVSIYLKVNFTSKGIGKQAVNFLEETARKNNIHVLLASICASNLASSRLFEKCGYLKCGYLKEVGYKFDKFLDVVDYQKVIG